MAYLQRRAAQQRERLEQALAAHADRRSSGFCTCTTCWPTSSPSPGTAAPPSPTPASSSATIHPAAAVAREHRQWLLATFTGLAAETTAPDPDALAAQLLQLYEAAAAMQIGGDDAAARTARTAAETLDCRAVPDVGTQCRVGTQWPSTRPPRRARVAMRPPAARAAAAAAPRAARRRTTWWPSSTAPTCPTATTSWPTTAPGRGSRDGSPTPAGPRRPDRRVVTAPPELLAAARGAAPARRRQLRRAGRSPRGGGSDGRLGASATARRPRGRRRAAADRGRGRRHRPAHHRRRGGRLPRGAGTRRVAPAQGLRLPRLPVGVLRHAPATARAAGATWPAAATGPRTGRGATVRIL